ncbi:MAG: flagellin [Enterococcus sp.]|nr:flagellin [Enterococcus sp.]
MGMSVNTNLASNNALRNLTQTNNNMSKSLERLSSGLRINRAADDASGFVISEGLKSQIGGLTVASRNAQDAVGVIQTAEGALTEVHSVLQRMRDLGVQASNDSNSKESRDAIKNEVDQLANELKRTIDSTDFGGIKLLNGTAGTAGSMSFQVGADGSAASQIKVSFKDITADLGGAVAATADAGSTLTFDNATNAAASIDALDEAIGAISTHRATLGASQNRIESAIKTIAVSVENLTSAKSRITDTDMAAEMTNFTKNQILSQAGTAMLAQANQSTQGILSLLR